MGLFDGIKNMAEDAKLELMKNELRKLRGVHKEISHIIHMDENDEIKSKALAGNVFAHIEMLENRNKELYNALDSATKEIIRLSNPPEAIEPVKKTATKQAKGKPTKKK